MKLTQNPNKAKDLRVRRTHKFIFDALIELTIKNGFREVTVSDITKYAQINRATFYRHYKDKFDLLNSYTQNVFEMLDNRLDSNFKTKNKKTEHQMPPGLVKIFEHVRENSTFYRVMLGKNGDSEFAEKIKSYIMKRVRASLPKNIKVDDKTLDLFITYSASASYGAVLWWLEHDMPYSNEEMIQIIGQLEVENLHNILGRERV